MSEAIEPTKVLIFVPESRFYDATSEISRVVWIFEVDRQWETTTIAKFVAKWGSEGWDTVEFRDKLQAAGYRSVTNYRGLNRREAKEFHRLIDGTVAAVAKAKAEQVTAT